MIILSSKTRYWLLQQTWNTSLCSTHLQTLRHPHLFLWSRRHFIDMLFPLQPNHSCWLRLSNPTGNCINHSEKLRNKTFGEFLPSLTRLSSTKYRRKSTFLGTTIWELLNEESLPCRCPQPQLQIRFYRRDNSSAFPHAKRNGFGTALDA